MKPLSSEAQPTSKHRSYVVNFAEYRVTLNPPALNGSQLGSQHQRFLRNIFKRRISG